MNFNSTSRHTSLYQAAALIQFNNPSYTANQIQDLLGVTSKEDKHSVDLGCWKAKKNLNLTGGYAYA